MTPTGRGLLRLSGGYSPHAAVTRAVWQPAGTLQAWVGPGGEWYGRVRGPDGHISWIPAAELRPDFTSRPTG